MGILRGQDTSRRGSTVLYMKHIIYYYINVVLQHYKLQPIKNKKKCQTNTRYQAQREDFFFPGAKGGGA